MNPLAEALKERTFKFALQIIVFCRTLRKTWKVANCRTSSFDQEHVLARTTDQLDALLDESTQLSRVFNQSQLTAKNNAIARRSR